LIYLAIMVLVAGAGIARLWLQQRRENARMNSVDGFRDSLQKISSGPANRRRTAGPRTQRPAPAIHAPRTQMDPARREAAKRRIEARRRARQHVA
jgi:hypothetical protein